VRVVWEEVAPSMIDHIDCMLLVHVLLKPVTMPMHKRRRIEESATQDMKECPLGDCLLKLFSFGIIMEAPLAWHVLFTIAFGVCQHMAVSYLLGCVAPTSFNWYV
jgi:hypothetical protein